MKSFIRNVYKERVVIGKSGNSHELIGEINVEQGDLIAEIIRNHSGIIKTLEVGCAYGLSSLHICMALCGREGAHHTIIDPFQSSEWDGAGVLNLEKSGVDFFNLIETKSEFALPRLLENNEGQYDFIFIDGWHTFDHTLLDCFYATRLLRTGGFLVIDDASWPSVKRVISYLKNYPCYEEFGSVGCEYKASWKKTLVRMLMGIVTQATWSKIMSPPFYQRVFNKRNDRMVVLQKTGVDDRNWDWHNDAF